MKNIFVLGSINYDMSIHVDVMPVKGETCNGHDFLSNSGGKGANQAVAISKLGGKCYLIGNVGNDVIGKECLNALHQYKVDTTYVGEVQCNTGVAVITINNGDNNIILDHGANYTVTSENVKEILRNNLHEGDIFVSQMEVTHKCVEESLRCAKKLGALTVFNPAPAEGITDAMLESTDIIIPNETEAEAITGIKCEEANGLEKMQAWFNAKGVAHVIITLGERGCFVDGKVYGANKVIPVDTTAAGDTFVGALTVMLAQGKTIEESIPFCQSASALTIQRKGAQSSIPFLSELK